MVPSGQDSCRMCGDHIPRERLQRWAWAVTCGPFAAMPTQPRPDGGRGGSTGVGGGNVADRRGHDRDLQPVRHGPRERDGQVPRRPLPVSTPTQRTRCYVCRTGIGADRRRRYPTTITCSSACSRYHRKELSRRTSRRHYRKHHRLRSCL